MLLQVAKQSLRTPEELNFFDPYYIISTNPNFRRDYQDISFRDEVQALTISLMNYILLQNHEHRFVSALVQRSGYAFWSKSYMITDSNSVSRAIAVPFVKNHSHKTEAYLLAVEMGNNDWSVKLMERSTLDTLLTTIQHNSPLLNETALFVIGMLKHDNRLFGVTDTLYSNWLSGMVDYPSSGVSFRGGCPYWIRDCWPRVHAIAPNENQVEVRDGSNGDWICVTYTFCSPPFDIPGGWWNGGGFLGGDGNNPGGGSGGGTPGVNPISNYPDLQILINACQAYLAHQGGATDQLIQFTTYQQQQCGNIIALMDKGLISIPDLNWLVQYTQGHSNPRSLGANIMSAILAYFGNNEPQLWQLEGVHAYIMALQASPPTTLPFSQFMNLYDIVHNKLTPSLALTPAEVAFLMNNGALANEIWQFLQDDQATQDAQEIQAGRIAANILIDLHMANRENGPIDQTYINVLEPYASHFSEEVLEECCAGIFIGMRVAMLVAEESIFLKRAHPNWSDDKIRQQALKSVIMGAVHTALDIIGLFPGLGEPADLLNGVLYIVEGDGVNATLSFGASLPVGGWIVTGAKYATILFTVGNKTYRMRNYVDAAGKVTFSHSGKLRAILGMGPAATDLRQAHHMIPEALWDNQLVQKAAKSGDGSKVFHMNSPHNGVPVPNTRHNGSHPEYSIKIRNELLRWDLAFPNATPDQAAQRLRQWQQALKNQIENSTQHINDIIPPQIPPL